MNFLELINKCLVELNYKQVNTFAELTKNDHNKIKNIINIINTEVCGFDKWNFLLKKTTLTLPKNKGEIENTIPGKIAAIYIGGQKYRFFEDFEKFLTNDQPMYTYSILNDKLLFPIFGEEKNIDVIYYTKNCAKSNDSTEKLTLEAEEDESLIPYPFVEPILVYGTCLRLKANPQHVKFNYWLSMYNDALANLRAKNCASAESAPNVTLFRH